MNAKKFLETLYKLAAMQAGADIVVKVVKKQESKNEIRKKKA